MSRGDIFHALALVLFALGLSACGDTPGGPDVVFAPRPALPIVPSSSVSVPANAPKTQCETINITARRVLSVSPGQVTLRVSAEYAGPGVPYVRLIDATTGVSYGDFPMGDITLSLPPGGYRLFVFVEVVTDNGVIQCDGSVSFTIPELPPPPTPECEEDCDSPPTCEELENCPEPPCTDDCGPPPCPEFATSGCEPPPVCQINDAGPFPKQGNPIAECGFFDTTPGDPGFYICKAGQDIYTSSNPFTGLTCPNGKEISHITTCACP